MITRTYALWGRSRKILASLVILSSVVAGLGMWNLFAGKPEPISSAIYPAITGCNPGFSSDKGHHVGAAWAGVVLLDTVIFALTVYKSLEFRRVSRQSIAGLLLRDGAIYFAVICTTTLGNVMSFMFGRPFSRGILTVTSNILSSVCASRLMLNIRHVKPVGLNGIPSTSTTYGNDIQLTSVVEQGPPFQIPSEELVEDKFRRPRRTNDPEHLSLKELPKN